MSQQANINYNRIAKAIEFIDLNFKEQPNLEQVAEKVNLSPYHFQRLFSDWAGTSPKKFLQFTTLEYAKTLLRANQATLFEATHELGLSGTSRLHDLFVNIEGMTPDEYKNGGKNLVINYSFAETPFGNILVASTQRGICHMGFSEEDTIAFSILQNHFPNALFKAKMDFEQQNALYIFSCDWSKLNQIKLHLKATDFQLKVWQSLLKIPFGQLTTYGGVAQKIENPKAFRAVGTAIGQNPIAFLIPCHRVIQSSGKIGEYMWGNIRKTVILGWEATRINDPNEYW